MFGNTHLSTMDPSRHKTALGENVSIFVHWGRLQVTEEIFLLRQPTTKPGDGAAGCRHTYGQALGGGRQSRETGCRR